MSALFFDSSALVKRYLNELLALHFDTMYRQVAIEEPILSRAVELTQKYRLRGYDAVQLATALVVNEQFVAAGFTGLALVSADNDVNSAAQAEGLQAENPNAH